MDLLLDVGHSVMELFEAGRFGNGGLVAEEVVDRAGRVDPIVGLIDVFGFAEHEVFASIYRQESGASDRCFAVNDSCLHA